MLNYWWVPVVLIMYAITSWLSVHAKNGWQFVFGLYILQCFGLWPIISRYSKNLPLDVLLFDLLIIISFYVTLWYMGQMTQFTFWQWFGFVLAITGIFLMKGIIK